MKLNMKLSGFFSGIRERKKRRNRTKMFLSAIKFNPEGQKYSDYLNYGKKFIHNFNPIPIKGKRSYIVDIGVSSYEAPLAIAVYSSSRFVVGGFLLSMLIRFPELEVVLIVLIVTVFAHMATNFAAYKMKLKKVPW
jgi:hypothetical protein